MSYEYNGSLYKVEEKKQVSDSFTVQEFILRNSTDPNYPQYTKFQTSNKGIEWLEKANMGDDINVTFDVRGVKYADKKTGEEKFFTSLSAWKIEVVGQSSGSGVQAATASNQPSEPQEDDLPF